jgi:glycosyltransferase involved in cell wall biosynthesis
LLRAVERAFGRRCDVKLLLVGQGFPGDPENSESDIRTFIQDKGLEHSVHLFGYRPDIPRLLAAMDLFCLVSYKEGLPLSVIEAMAAGLPVVVTDIDGLREVVHTGVNGLLVTPDDVEGLARTLQTLASDSMMRRRLGDEGRRIARDKYSFARCLSQTEGLLSAVAPSRRPTI